MPRPLRMRRVWSKPDITHFKPAGRRLAGLEEVNLTIDELEAIRLKDLENLDQTKAAKKMNISQPTFNRLLDTARKKVAEALVKGRAIRIGGGTYEMVRPRGGRFRARVRGGRGRLGGPYAAGPSGNCVCSKCGYKVKHKAGLPCSRRVCPKCKIRLVRG